LCKNVFASYNSLIGMQIQNPHQSLLPAQVQPQVSQEDQPGEVESHSSRSWGVLIAGH